MTIVASNDPRIITVEVTDGLIIAHLADGRTIAKDAAIARLQGTEALWLWTRRYGEGGCRQMRVGLGWCFVPGPR